MRNKAHLANDRSLYRLGVGLFVMALAAFVLFKHILMTEQSLYWLVTLPILFLGMGYGMQKALRWVSVEKYLVNFYLGLKVTKIICLILILLAYIFLFQVDWTFLLPMFFAFYLLYLVWETRFLFRYERSLKTKML